MPKAHVERLSSVAAFADEFEDVAKLARTNSDKVNEMKNDMEEMKQSMKSVDTLIEELRMQNALLKEKVDLMEREMKSHATGSSSPTTLVRLSDKSADFFDTIFFYFSHGSEPTYPDW